MANSKIIFNGQVLIDLTQDTVASDKLLKGYTAHGKNGELLTGTCTFDADTQDATAAADEILVGKIAYVKGAKRIGTMANNGAVTLKISTKDDKVKIPAGFHDGTGDASIADGEKAKLIPENIRAGVTVLGVQGEMTGTEDAVAESIEVVPTAEDQTFLPNSDEGYNYIAQVTVKAIPYKEVANETGGMTITIG